MGGAQSETALLTSPRNMYDLSKMNQDFIAKMSNINSVGLRFGTVSGPSINFRPELILNKMTKDAKSTGVITVANPDAFRACLSINDLVRAIEILVQNYERIILEDKGHLLFNLANFSMTIKEIAETVAKCTASSIVYKESDLTYSFSMQTNAFKNYFSYSFEKNIEGMITELE